MSPGQMAGAHFQIASTYFAEERAEEARAELAKVLVIEDVSAHKKAQMLQIIADSFRADGMIDEARAELKKILDMDGQSFTTRLRISFWVLSGSTLISLSLFTCHQGTR